MKKISKDYQYGKELMKKAESFLRTSNVLNKTYFNELMKGLCRYFKGKGSMQCMRGYMNLLNSSQEIYGNMKHSNYEKILKLEYWYTYKVNDKNFYVKKEVPVNYELTGDVREDIRAIIPYQEKILSILKKEVDKSDDIINTAWNKESHLGKVIKEISKHFKKNKIGVSTDFFLFYVPPNFDMNDDYVVGKVIHKNFETIKALTARISFYPDEVKTRIGVNYDLTGDLAKDVKALLPKFKKLILTTEKKVTKYLDSSDWGKNLG